MGAPRNGVNYKHLTSTATVTTADTPGILYGIILSSSAVGGDAVLTLTDGGSGGTTVAVIKSEAAVSFNPGIVFETDIYATIAGTATVNATIIYEEIG